MAERGIEFEQAVDLLSRTLTNQGLVSNEGVAVARVISDYARSWSLLQGYDEQQLAEVGIKQPDMQPLLTNTVSNSWRLGKRKDNDISRALSDART